MPERVPASLSYTRSLLIGRQNGPFRNNNNIIYNYYYIIIYNNNKKLNTLPAKLHFWKMLRKSLKSYIVALCSLCRVPLFPWIY